MGPFHKKQKIRLGPKFRTKEKKLSFWNFASKTQISCIQLVLTTFFIYFIFNLCLPFLFLVPLPQCR
jgi:hypothetical protein